MTTCVSWTTPSGSRMVNESTVRGVHEGGRPQLARHLIAFPTADVAELYGSFCPGCLVAGTRRDHDVAAETAFTKETPSV